MKFTEDDLLFKDWIKKIKEFGKTEFITVHHSEGEFNLGYTAGIYCALIPQKQLSNILLKYEWDLRRGNGRPGYIFSYKNEKEIAKYYRFGDRNGIEPLVHYRSFPDGVRYLEISEEFRHYFDLQEIRNDINSSKFITFDDDGDEVVVAVISNKELKIKLSFIKEFLAVKKMYLAIYFDVMRFSDNLLSEIQIDKTDKIVTENNLIYSLSLRDYSTEKFRIQSWLMGKKIIEPLKKFSPTIFDKPLQQFTSFIIGIDENGENIFYTCNEEELSDFFDKNIGLPNYLTPIFFKKDVLSKYYNNPHKYLVHDGMVERKGFWSLFIDNNHPSYVSVFLGDLGKLSYKEQLYWKHYNVYYEGGISHTSFERNIEAKFSDPELPDLYFKMKLNLFTEKWRSKFGWDLFKPLAKEDMHYLESLHIPSADNQKEFDEQILSITKIMIDSLNEKKLINEMNNQAKDFKSIDKLNAFLENKNITIPPMIKFFRNLQTLRSTSVAHRKSTKNRDYKKALEYFKLNDKGFDEIFSNILIKSIWSLNSLEKKLLTDQSNTKI
ncbi:MAG: hypothetical protein A2068_14985 [Ignavibacteria bacterium GWB2_35_6b]|nr:MAG: hypothetical protein A2068_14985 [Ignavibacteria bacterium GWB2_35_6b]